MTKRKHGHAFTGHLYYGYGGQEGTEHRGPRRHRSNQSHFSAAHIHESAMDEGGHTDKKARNHEAHMIPGVDGHRVFGFPNSIISKLRYCDIIALTGTTTTAGYNVFAANGIFDPDISGVGHQPQYRDQFANMYENYKVIGSKIKVTWLPRTAGVCLFGGINGDNDSTVSTNVTVLMEQNNSIHGGIAPPGAPLTTMSQTFEPLLDIGTDSKDDGASLTLMSANPSELFCFNVWASAGDQTSTWYCDVMIEIDYTVKFSQLLTPVQN